MTIYAVRVIADTYPLAWPVVMDCIFYTISLLDSCQALKYRACHERNYMEHTDSGEEIIFVKWFRHWKTGKKVYPKNGKVIAIRIRKPKKQ